VKMSGVVELINRARNEKRLCLTEAESKKLLNAYGIPVVKEIVVDTQESAVVQSKAIGFPVVLKGLGAKLTHKTERGLVKVNLRSAAEVRRAYREVTKSAGPDWEGCLIQPLVAGKREFVAGMFRDAQFGPAVMFGLGGVFTEALGDVTFRIAPLSGIGADEMVDEIKSSKLLSDFRGEQAADREQLRQVLMGLSRLGMDYPQIKEVDINPLIVAPDGTIKAVDALVVLEAEDAVTAVTKQTEAQIESRAVEIRAALDAVTHAKAIAVIGASPARHGFPGMYGCMRNFGFRGRLYPVNPKYEDIDGHKSYPSLVSLPEKVDLVIISIPAPFVADALKDCIASGNLNVHIFTSGFKETGEMEGDKLQAQIEKIAREGGLRVVGPNCMGFYVPKARMLTWTAAAGESGPLALISQSGGNAQDFTNYTSVRYGIYFNKAISYGNALTLDSTDFLDYLDHDEETRIITMYLEGVKDGRHLLDLVTRINRRKPVIIYKGGLTEAGARAVSSHTGSLAGGLKIWNAFFRQSGAVPAESLEEMADVALAFHHLGETPGRRTTVLGIGGGIGVSVADSCARAGLELPALSDDTVKKLRSYIPPAGTMIRNPIDSVGAFKNLDIMGSVLALLAASGEIDNFIISVPLDWLFGEEEGGAYIKKIADYLATEGRKYTGGKPLVVVWRQYQPNPEIRKCTAVMEDILLSAGIPVYEGLPRAVTALAKLAGYCEYQVKNRNYQFAASGSLLPAA
jgi:acyl-CoA synthetase (NDP forming)